MVAKISEIKKVWPVLLEALRKYNPLLRFLIACVIMLYTMRYSRTNFGKLIFTNVPKSSTSKCVSLANQTAK